MACHFANGEAAASSFQSQSWAAAGACEGIMATNSAVAVRMRNFPSAWVAWDSMHLLPQRIAKLLSSFGSLAAEPEVYPDGASHHGLEARAVFQDGMAAARAVAALHGVDGRSRGEREASGDAPPQTWELFWLQQDQEQVNGMHPPPPQAEEHIMPARGGEAHAPSPLLGDLSAYSSSCSSADKCSALTEPVPVPQLAAPLVSATGSDQPQLQAQPLLSGGPDSSEACYLLIGNLGHTWTKAHVKTLFVVYGGALQVKLLDPDHVGTRWAHVVLKNPRSYEKAVKYLNNARVGDNVVMAECVITCELIRATGATTPNTNGMPGKVEHPAATTTAAVPPTAYDLRSCQAGPPAVTKLAAAPVACDVASGNHEAQSPAMTAVVAAAAVVPASAAPLARSSQEVLIEDVARLSARVAMFDDKDHERRRRIDSAVEALGDASISKQRRRMLESLLDSEKKRLELLVQQREAEDMARSEEEALRWKRHLQEVEWRRKQQELAIEARELHSMAWADHESKLVERAYAAMEAQQRKVEAEELRRMRREEADARKLVVEIKRREAKEMQRMAKEEQLQREMQVAAQRMEEERLRALKQLELDREAEERERMGAEEARQMKIEEQARRKAEKRRRELEAQLRKRLRAEQKRREEAEEARRQEEEELRQFEQQQLRKRQFLARRQQQEEEEQQREEELRKQREEAEADRKREASERQRMQKEDEESQVREQQARKEAEERARLEQRKKERAERKRREEEERAQRLEQERMQEEEQQQRAAEAERQRKAKEEAWARKALELQQLKDVLREAALKRQAKLGQVEESRHKEVATAAAAQQVVAMAPLIPSNGLRAFRSDRSIGSGSRRGHRRKSKSSSSSGGSSSRRARNSAAKESSRKRAAASSSSSARSRKRSSRSASSKKAMADKKRSSKKQRKADAGTKDKDKGKDKEKERRKSSRTRVASRSRSRDASSSEKARRKSKEEGKRKQKEKSKEEAKKSAAKDKKGNSKKKDTEEKATSDEEEKMTSSKKAKKKGVESKKTKKKEKEKEKEKVKEKEKKKRRKESVAGKGKRSSATSSNS